MRKFVFALCCLFGYMTIANAKQADFKHYFEVDMAMDLPDIQEYAKEINKKTIKPYDKGYVSRYQMGKQFKKEFSRTIRLYGSSENRIKREFEDDLLEIISWLPQEMYQYIGPMLHEVPGMSEKILNLPGIKETKNKFPEKIAEKYKDREDIEFLSPALYFLLMPEIWDKKEENLDEPTVVPVKKPKVQVDLPDFLKEKINEPISTPKNASQIGKSSAKNKTKDKDAQVLKSRRTLFPTKNSALTTLDAEAVIASFDDIRDWAMQDNMKRFSQIINASVLLDMWEQEQGTALSQNGLKDLVNPCQRLVLKIRFANLYEDFSTVVAKQGLNPKEWGYTCDKTLKAYRVADINHSVAYAVQFHRRGYYDKYIKQFPEKWQDKMYANEAAIVGLYTVLKEDVEAVRPIKDKILKKIIENNGMIITSPIVY